MQQAGLYFSGAATDLETLLLLQGYGMGLPAQMMGQQGSEGYMQQDIKQEEDEEGDDATRLTRAEAEADAEGALFVLVVAAAAAGGRGL